MLLSGVECSSVCYSAALRFTMYNDTVGEEVACLLRHYQDQGLLEVTTNYSTTRTTITNITTN